MNELPVLHVRLGVSQADIAEKIEISRQTYNGIETGKNELDNVCCLDRCVPQEESNKAMLRGINRFEDKVDKEMNL